MITKYYRFAGRTLAVISDFPFEESEYTVDFAVPDGENAADADFTVRVTRTAELPAPPDGAAESARYTAWRDPVDGSEMCVRYYCKNINCRRVPYSFAVRCGRHTEVGFARDAEIGITARVILEAAGLVGILLDAGCIVLHSSFVLSDGAAVIFSGASGAGKSTQAEQWRRAFGAEVINGDRTLISLRDGGADACGIIWCGTSGICRNETAPVRVIALVSHGETNSVRPASPIDAFTAVLGQTTYDTKNPREVGAATAVCADLVSHVPVVRFSCLPDESAAQYLRKYLDEVDKNGK